MNNNQMMIMLISKMKKAQNMNQTIPQYLINKMMMVLIYLLKLINLMMKMEFKKHKQLMNRKNKVRMISLCFKKLMISLILFNNKLKIHLTYLLKQQILFPNK